MIVCKGAIAGRALQFTWVSGISARCPVRLYAAEPSMAKLFPVGGQPVFLRLLGLAIPLLVAPDSCGGLLRRAIARVDARALRTSRPA